MYTPCLECGSSVADGLSGCIVLFQELVARGFSDYRYFAPHRLMVDAYAVQHPSDYCASAKSLLAHLGGLCCQFDYDGDPQVHQSLLKSLNGTPGLERPAPPAFRGELTVAHILEAPDPAAFEDAVKEWARSAWEAYSGLHSVTRGWMKDALLLDGRAAHR